MFLINKKIRIKWLKIFFTYSVGYIYYFNINRTIIELERKEKKRESVRARLTIQLTRFIIIKRVCVYVLIETNKYSIVKS